MKLEEEIKQTKPFKSEFQKLVLNISFTSSWLNNIIAERLKAFNLTPHQFNVLRILKGKYPESYCNQDITQRMIDKSSNATRIVDKLVLKKLAVRINDVTDRRLVNISITKEGLALLEEIDKAPFSKNTKLKKINEEKARLMNEWLDELRS
jgi:DNA-binding MarR family transcriptional regulator